MNKQIAAAMTFGFLALGLFPLNFPDLFIFAEIVFPFVLSLIGSYGAYLAMPRRLTLTEQIIMNGGFTNGVNPAVVEEVVTTGTRRVNALLECANRIKDPHVSLRLEQIASIAQRILDGFLDDPDDIQRSRDFLKIYLVKTVEVAEKFEGLEGKKEIDMEKFNAVLDQMEKTFEQQYEKNLSDDELDFTVTMEVLNERMKLSGV